MFVERIDEMARLEEWWAMPAPRLALVWGRRRVGKTLLLQRFAEARRCIFHTGAGRPAAGELRQLSRSAATAGITNLRDLERRPYQDWDDALESIAVEAKSEPLLLVLDEFPEIVATCPELPGVLRAALDRFAGSTRLRILICGSAVRTMTTIQEERAPLYGRFDLALHLHPFQPYEAAQMLGGMPAAEQALVYGLVGGMPLYLSWWDTAAQVQDNLARLVCRPGAPLLLEGELVLATEADRGDQPAAVLHAIAAGRTRHNQIAEWAGVEPSRALDRLIESRLVERLMPVTESTRSRRRSYRIVDNFLTFYLGLVTRYRADIERGLGASVLRPLISSLDDHMGPVWEQMFRMHLLRLAASQSLPGDPDVVAVGPWWRANGEDEIDAVVLAGRSRRPSLVGEAKWARTVDGRAIRRALERKAVALGSDPDALTYAICAREQITGLSANDMDMLPVTAEDIFAP